MSPACSHDCRIVLQGFRKIHSPEENEALTSPRIRRLLINSAVAFTSTLLTLLLIEASFYRYFPQPTYAIRLSAWGFEHIPNISFKHTPESKETISYITYNSEGFRGSNEYSVNKKPDTLRVAILGDSYGEGAEVDYQYLHGTLLEQMLNEYLPKAGGRYHRAEVIKAGVYAYESCQELRLFESRVQKYQPDIVFVIYTGELHDNVTFCRLDGETLKYVDLPYSGSQYVARYVLSYVRAKSHLLNYVGRVTQHLLGSTPVQVPELLNKTFSYAPPPMRDFVEATRTVDHLFSHYLQLSDELTDVPTDYEHRLLFAIFERLGKQAGSYGGKVFIGFSHMDPSGSAFAHSAYRSGIGSLNLFSYVNDHRTRPAHLSRDGHWNEYGHYLVAKAFFETVQYQLGHSGANVSTVSTQSRIRR